LNGPDFLAKKPKSPLPPVVKRKTLERTFRVQNGG